MATSTIPYINKVDTPSTSAFNVSFVFSSEKDGGYYYSNSVYVPTGFELDPQSALPSNVILGKSGSYYSLHTSDSNLATKNLMVTCRVVRS